MDETITCRNCGEPICRRANENSWWVHVPARGARSGHYVRCRSPLGRHPSDTGLDKFDVAEPAKVTP